MKNETKAGIRRLFLIVSTVLSLSLFVSAQQVMRFAIIGDFGSGDTNERDVADLVKSWNPDFIITTGDNNYPDGEAATIDRNIGQFYHGFIHPYMGTYGPGATTNRFFPSVGNHDLDNRVGAPLQPYLEYFALPGNERYYDFQWGPVHFFSVNSDTREPDGVTSNSVQGEWLQARLAASTAQWKIVYMHHPPYSSRTSWVKLQWPFEEWGADIVFAGHAHVYERVMLNGFPYITNGLGGDSTGSFSSGIEGSVARFGSNYGAMLATVTQTSITFQFVTRSGDIIDTYTMGPDAVPPAQPTSLNGTLASNDRANLAWTDAAINEDGYRVELSVNGGNFTEIGSVIANVNNFTATGITLGGVYSFRVRGINNAGYSGYSNTVTLSHGTVTVPNAPSALTAQALDSQRIELSWTDNSTNEGGFRIERCAGAACTDFAEAGTAAAGATSIVDGNLTPATLYRYRVTAYNQAGSSPPSNVAEATTEIAGGPTEPPTGLAAEANSQTEISLSWTDDSDNEDAFHIERCAGAGCVVFEEVGEAGANSTTFDDSGLAAGTVYRYRVRARVGTEYSSYSNTAEAATFPASGGSLLADDFNDGTMDATKWFMGQLSRAASNYDPLIGVSETGGELVITPRSSYSSASYGGYVSNAEWDLTGRSATVQTEVAQNNAVTIFSVGVDKDNWLSFRAKGRTLYLESRIGGSTSKTSVRYDEVAHRYWRIRHDAATDTIRFEASANGAIWSTLRSVQRTMGITLMRVELVAGTGGSVSSPGQARFDNFVLLDQ